MIKRLRKKFIIVATCSVFAVLILIVGVINIVNYANVVKNADQLVMLLKDGAVHSAATEIREKSPSRPTEVLCISPNAPFRRKLLLKRDILRLF